MSGSMFTAAGGAGFTTSGTTRRSRTFYGDLGLTAALDYRRIGFGNHAGRVAPTSAEPIGDSRRGALFTPPPPSLTRRRT